jgi:hypothetical protein
MKYCNNTTISHNIAVNHPACLQDINHLLIAEGYSGSGPVFTNNEIIINLDKAEEIIASQQARKKNKSMDMAFGISNFDSSIIEILMVELKFNLNDFYFLKKNDLEGKVLGSMLVLQNNPSIHSLFIFIFTSNNLQEAKNRLARMDPKINNNYVPMDIQQLKAKYF